MHKSIMLVSIGQHASGMIVGKFGEFSILRLLQFNDDDDESKGYRTAIVNVVRLF